MTLLLLLYVVLEVHILFIVEGNSIVSSSEFVHTIIFGRTEPIEFPFNLMNLIDGDCGINDSFSCYMGI